MRFFEFLQKGLSEDNGNPSQRRINVFYALILFTTGVFIAYFVVIFWIPALLMEMTIALLAWITTALGLGIIAKTKEQKTIGNGVNAAPEEKKE